MSLIKDAGKVVSGAIIAAVAVTSIPDAPNIADGAVAVKTRAIEIPAHKIPVWGNDTVITKEGDTVVSRITIDSVSVPKKIKPATMKCNPLIYLSESDEMVVTIEFNGKIVRRDTLEHADSLVPDGFGLLPVVKAALVVSKIPMDSLGNLIVVEDSVVLSTRK